MAKRSKKQCEQLSHLPPTCPYRTPESRSRSARFHCLDGDWKGEVESRTAPAVGRCP